MNRLKRLVVIVAVASLIAGCTGISRGLGKLTDNKYAEARSGSIWVVAPPQLEPPPPADKNVYISYRNISDADIELGEQIKEAAREQGWKIVNDPTQAKYRLRASLRFFGEVAPDSGGATKALAMGLIAGAAVGVGTAHLVNSTTGGVIVGGAAASLLSAGMANGSKPREWALIIDFVLEEYNKKPVEFTLATGDASSVSSGADVANARTAIGGGSTSGNSKNASMTQQSNYFPHGVRLSVWANQMNMNEEESLPHILKRTKNVITKLLPM